MRFYKKLIFFCVCLFLFGGKVCFAKTVITAPLDSRPVSTDYLENLAAIAGDQVLTVPKDTLDFFSDQADSNHFADSRQVRDTLAKLVANHNTKDTTVIINSASYLTRGLVGSRTAPAYENWDDSLAALKELLEAYQEPTYYFNLAMPRNLPESRLNPIWPNTDKLRGIGYYYLKYNKDVKQAEPIKKQYEMVTPEQFLMEWAYLLNKKEELGKESLAKWEEDFLTIFEAKYSGNPDYEPYIESYRIPYLTAGNMLYHLLQWQKQGLLEEIVITNDDLELPASIAYFYKNVDQQDWIPEENGAAIKFSFARTYMTEGVNSIYQFLKKEVGTEEAEAALRGAGKKVNFIFGMDEVPQLIYARDLAKRTHLSANFSLKGVLAEEGVGSYDVLSAKTLLENAIRFVTGEEGKEGKTFSIVLYDYNAEKAWDQEQVLQTMQEDFSSNIPIGLIEILSPEIVYGNKTNHILQALLEQKEEGKLSAAQLAAYSAWNTNANAIGLGIAHSQVYTIAKQLQTDGNAWIEAQARHLATHLLEDGFYIAKGKRALSLSGFSPKPEEQTRNEKLLEVLEADKVLEAMKRPVYQLDGESYEITEASLTGYGFPWGRLFDIALTFQMKVEKQ